MKKKNIVDLIKYHTENNDVAFRTTAYSIAREFEKMGEDDISFYITSLLSSTSTFVPQMSEEMTAYFSKKILNNDILPLPDLIMEDLSNIINVIKKNIGLNKFLFYGDPGTGKTESSKQVARLLGREIFEISFSEVIDSKLGKTQKNIVELFKEMNHVKNPEKIIFLLDEIDALALDRVNQNDLREMGRVTSTILKELDELNSQVILIATTNLYEKLDKALVRRFDFKVDFNRYSHGDLVEISEQLLESFLTRYKVKCRNKRLFRKILMSTPELPYPGELKNIIKTSVAFNDEKMECDYLKKIYKALHYIEKNEIGDLNNQGYTLREMEILTGISKSKIARDIKGDNNE